MGVTGPSALRNIIERYKPPLDAHKSLRTSDFIPVIELLIRSEIKGSTPECSDSFRYEEGFTLLSLKHRLYGGGNKEKNKREKKISKKAG